MIPAVVMAALIAAIASLLVSTVVAFKFERVKRFVALEDDDTRKTLEFLGKSIEILQEFRDKLTMIAYAPNDSLSSESAVAMLRESLDAFSALYRGGLPVAPRRIATQVHDTKGVLIRATIKMEDLLRNGVPGEMVRDVAEDERQTLRDCLVLLTDARLEIRVRGVAV